jgi:hypothetical protein
VRALRGDGAVLIRAVRALDGDLHLEHVVAAGGFGAEPGRWAGPRAVADGRSLVLAGDGRHREEADRRWTVTRLTAARNEWAVLGLQVEGGRPCSAAELMRLLGDEEEDAAVRHAVLPRQHPDRALDALRVIEALTWRPTGAVVAALTTSLPEAPGADRQFDYRYCWVRDSSLAVSVAALLGRGELARGYLEFVLGLCSERLPTEPCVTVTGESVPEEVEVPGVAGWAGSRPVRVGNAAADQYQPDVLGFLVEAVWVYLQTGGRLDDRIWSLVRRAADACAESIGEPSSGIWELRRPAQLVSDDVARWLALDRALRLARLLRPLAPRRAWRRARTAARERVLGALRSDGFLPNAYDGPPAPDAAGLMTVLFGLLDRRDPRASRLVDATVRSLGAGPFLRRYGDVDDGFHGREGAFLPVSWWAVGALARVGRVEEASERASGMCSELPPLLAEQWAPERLCALGNVPLLWSHMEAARAMYLLEAEDLRRRFGSAGLKAWRAGRYARLVAATTRTRFAAAGDRGTGEAPEGGGR